MNELELLLGSWANFYLIMSAAAGTLIGLLFVVITLAAERGLEGVNEKAEINVYLTPTVVYFASVLVVAALLTFPNHTRLTATLCICLVGVSGLFYLVSRLIGGTKSYEKRHDVIPYAGFPFVAYGLLILGGALILHDAQSGLTFAAVGMISLLTIGIRNSWAIAIEVVASPRRQR